MSDDVKYLFWISLLLVVLAYWAGALKLIPALGTQLVNVIFASSGRNLQGQFAPYPGNAPTS